MNFKGHKITIAAGNRAGVSALNHSRALITSVLATKEEVTLCWQPRKRLDCDTQQAVALCASRLARGLNTWVEINAPLRESRNDTSSPTTKPVAQVRDIAEDEQAYDALQS